MKKLLFRKRGTDGPLAMQWELLAYDWKPLGPLQKDRRRQSGLWRFLRKVGGPFLRAWVAVFFVLFTCVGLASYIGLAIL
jgi:hypothetical protein